MWSRKPQAPVHGKRGEPRAKQEQLSKQLGLLTPLELSSLPLTEPLLSTLGPNDQAILTFDTAGCFHNFRFELSFTGPLPISVSVVDVPLEYQPRPPAKLGLLPLDVDEVERLDRVVAFYRTHPRGYCTTVDTITIAGLMPAMTS